jgi:hypothetical protein
MDSRRSTDKIKDSDLRPDGWERFEAAVDAAIKSGPKHRTSTKPRLAKKKTRFKGRKTI